jgi:CarboxypepD_reg-like domain
MYQLSVKKLALLCSFLGAFGTSFSQSEIRGKIFDMQSGKIIKGASVGLHSSKRGTLADSTGYFNFHVPRAKKTDTLIISSVGFMPLKMTIAEARLLNEFRLTEIYRDIKGVTVKAFSNRSSSGSIINLPQTEYKLEKVKFKINNSCDSCLFKLHIRSVYYNLPGEDLLTDSIAILVNKQMVWSNARMPEFDLSEYNIVLKGKQIFVGVEVQGCVQPTTSACSLSFVGTDKGGFVFKSNSKAEWQQSVGDYDIYEKVEFSY